MRREGNIHIGEFQVDARHHKEFVEYILESAKASVATEPGCRQFEVLVPTDGSSRVFLFEFFDTREAFEAHQTTEHFRRWKEKAAHWIEGVRGTELQRVL